MDNWFVGINAPDEQRKKLSAQDLHDMVHDLTLKYYEHGDRDTTHPPIFAVSRWGFVAFLSPDEFGDEASKADLRRIMQNAAQQGADSMCTVVEAWGVKEGTHKKYKDQYARIADMPADDRQEMVIIHAVSKGENVNTIYHIDRSGDKVKLIKQTMDQTKSRFHDNLPWAVEQN